MAQAAPVVAQTPVPSVLLIENGAPVSLVPTIERCSRDENVALAALFVGGVAVQGTWSGEGVVVSGDSLLTRQMPPGSYVLTFTPLDGCGSESSVIVELGARTDTELAAVQWCRGGPIVGLAPYLPTGVGDGTWSGDGVVGEVFDPRAYVGAGTGVIVYRYGGVCESTVSLPFTLVDEITLATTVIEICGDSTVTLADYDPVLAPGGDWRGVDGTIVREVDFSTLSPGQTFEFTYVPPSGSCGAKEVSRGLRRANESTIDLPQTDTLCAAAGAIALSDRFPGVGSGSWSGDGATAEGLYTPGRYDGATALRFRPDGGCFDSVEYTTRIVDVPELAHGPPAVSCADNTYSAEVVILASPNNGPIRASLGNIAGTILTVVGMSVDLPATVLLSDAPSCSADAAIVLPATCTPLNACEPPVGPGTFPPGPVALCPANLSSLGGYDPPAEIRVGDSMVFRVYADTAAVPLAELPFAPVDFGPYQDLGRVFLRAAVGPILSDGSLDPACTAFTRAQEVIFGGDPVATRDTVVCGIAPPFNLELYGTTFSPNAATQIVRVPSPNGGCDSVITLTVDFEGGFTVPIRRQVCQGDTIQFRGEVFDESRPAASLVFGTAECSVTYDVLVNVLSAGRLTATESICEGESVFYGGQELFESAVHP